MSQILLMVIKMLNYVYCLKQLKFRSLKTIKLGVLMLLYVVDIYLVKRVEMPRI